MNFEASPTSDRASIPPISRPSPRPVEGKGWLPIVLAGLVVAAILGASHAPRAAAHSAFPDIEKPRPILITEAARTPAPKAVFGHRALARPGAVVPESAIVDMRGTPTVFVHEADYRFVATPVVLGETGADGQQVLSGIRAGQVVVTDGAEALKAHLVVQ